MLKQYRALLAGVLASAMLFGSAGLAGAAARPTGLMVPDHGALFGAWINPNGSNGWTQAEASNFDTQLGRKVAIDLHYKAWTENFPNSPEKWDVANGITPLMTWGGGLKAGGLDAINAGTYDNLIRARADAIKALHVPVFLRPLWEMNGKWMPWNGTNASTAGTTDGPQKYIRAWRHMHDIFKQEGATNVAWVFSPDVHNLPDTAWNNWSSYYPGDAYVDWVAPDGYNRGTTQSWSKWESFASIFQPVYDAFAGRKPFMVGETATCDQGGSKAQWILDAGQAVKNQFPNVDAFLYWNSVDSCDYRVNTSANALAALRTVANDPYFGATTAAPTAPPASTLAPSVSGDPQVGSALTATTGFWDGQATAFAFQWDRCDLIGAGCAPISGANDVSYVLGDGDVGSTVRVDVSATNSVGTTTVSSAPIAGVTGLTAPSSVNPPTISGAARDGQTLTASTGDWSGYPTGYAYQWSRCSGGSCGPIAGATGATYVLVSADVGATVFATVTASNGAGTASAASAATSPVNAVAPANVVRPTISGTAAVGSTLTAGRGTWSGTSPMTTRYQWRRCTGTGCIRITGETGSSYTVTNADSGYRMSVVVTVTNSVGSASLNANATARVP